MDENAGSIRSSLGTILKDVSQLDQVNHDSVELLRDIHEVKSRVESSATTMTEVDSWSTKREAIESSFSSRSLEKVRLVVWRSICNVCCWGVSRPFISSLFCVLVFVLASIYLFSFVLILVLFLVFIYIYIYISLPLTDRLQRTSKQWEGVSRP